jgi:hypothetical protein
VCYFLSDENKLRKSKRDIGKYITSLKNKPGSEIYV